MSLKLVTNKYGRTSYIKDPFWVHNKPKDSELTSAVITTGGHHLESGNDDLRRVQRRALGNGRSEIS